MRHRTRKPQLHRAKLSMLEMLETRWTPATFVYQDGLYGYTGTQDAEFKTKDNKIEGSKDKISIELKNASEQKQALLRFDNLFGNAPWQIPFGSTIYKVTLVLTPKEGKGGTISINRLLVDWNESLTSGAAYTAFGNGIQLNDVEARSAADATFSGSGNQVRELTSDALRDTVQAWLDGTADNFGWVLTSNSNNKFEFYTSEERTQSLRPQLIIEFTSPISIAHADTLLSLNGAAGSLDVLANDIVANDLPATIEIVQGPSFGTFSLTGSTITYTPNAGFAGTDTLTYRFVTSQGASNMTTVTLLAAREIVLQEGVNGYVGTHDTYLHWYQPDSVYGDADKVSIQERSRHGLLRFDNLFGNSTNQIPAGATVLSASLTLNIFDDDNDPKPQDGQGGGKLGSNLGFRSKEFALLNMLQAWDESSTWNSLTNGLSVDDVELQRGIVASLPRQAGLQTADVTASVRAWANGDANNGWGIMRKGKSDAWAFSSSEASDPTSRPRLAILFVPQNPPTTPSDPPIALPDFYTGPAGNVINGNVLLNDSDPNNLPLTAVLIDGPSLGKLSFNPDGTFTYTPLALFVGSDTFTYYADNGSQASDTVTVTITFTALQPLAQADFFTGTVGSPVTGNVLVNDIDPVGLPLTAVLFGAPTQGVVIFNPNGTFTYTPNNPAFVGTDFFSYKANNGTLQSVAVSVEIFIAPPATPPVQPPAPPTPPAPPAPPTPPALPPATQPTPVALTATGVQQANASVVVVTNADGTQRFVLPAFQGVIDRINVQMADVDGDGWDDVVVAAGFGGGPHVKVFSGRTGQLLSEFMAYDPAFRGGVNLVLADLNGDGRAEMIVAPGFGGGPHVKVYDGLTGQVVREFMAYDPAFRGGVNLAALDYNGDGVTDIVTGAGPGGGPHVRVFSGGDYRELASFFATPPTQPTTPPAMGVVNMPTGTASEGPAFIDQAAFFSGVRVGAVDLGGGGGMTLVTNIPAVNNLTAFRGTTPIELDADLRSGLFSGVFVK